MAKLLAAALLIFAAVMLNGWSPWATLLPGLALTAAGVDTALHLYDGADHMWRGAPDAAADAVQRTIAFLTAHLHPTPGAPS